MTLNTTPPHQTALQQAQQALKTHIASEHNHAVLHMVVAPIERFLQAAFGVRTVPPWLGPFIVAATAAAFFLAVGAVLGELAPARTGLIVLGAIQVLIGQIFFRLQTESLQQQLVDNIVEAIQSIEDLVDLRQWWDAYSNRRAVALIAVLGGLVTGVVMSLVFSSVVEEHWSGIAVTLAAMYVQGWYLAGLIPMVMVYQLAMRLGDYHFSLYDADPSSSVIIRHLSTTFMMSLYLWAIVAAVVSLSAPLVGLDFVPSALLIIPQWALTVVYFAVIQRSLSRLITTRKYTVLARLQAQINRLQTDSDVRRTDNLDVLNRLMDYHTRLKNTPNSALDLSAAINLFNTLLLPLIAFLLANLSSIFALFR